MRGLEGDLGENQICGKLQESFVIASKRLAVVRRSRSWRCRNALDAAPTPTQPGLFTLLRTEALFFFGTFEAISDSETSGERCVRPG